MNNNKILFASLVIILIITISIYILEFSKKNIETFDNKLIKNNKMPEQLDLLTYSDFSYKCCPSTYSSSMGCLCNNHDEKKAITTRGGNMLS